MTTQNDDHIKTLIKSHADYHTASVDLRSEISALIKTPKKKRTWTNWMKSLNLQPPQLAGGALMGAILATLLTSQILRGQADKESIYLALLADHTHAVVTQHTIEVQSSNQHTVKPWLSSQLGYSPQVVDMNEQGFPLIGGRRGFIGSTPVAVAVYAYKQHEIDVYVMTTDVYQLFPANFKSKNGFNLNSWRIRDLHYVAVADINESLLKQFSEELANKQKDL